MRRFLGPALLGGVAVLVGPGGLLRFFVADRVIVTPIDQYAQTTSPGPGSYLDPATLQVRSADLVAVRTTQGRVASRLAAPARRAGPPAPAPVRPLKGALAASTKDTAVWDVSVVLSTGDGQLV